MSRSVRYEPRSRVVAASILILVPALVALGCGRKSAEGYLRAGDQAMRDNQLASAQENYESAVKLAPRDAAPHVKLGDLYVFERNYPAAEIEFTKACDLQPGNATSHAALAKLYSARAQWGSAENQMRAAVALNPSSAEYRRQLAAVLNRRNQVGQAEIELRTAVGLTPGDARLHLALANFLSTIPNERATADEEFARVRQLDPSLLAASSVPLPPPEAPAPPEGPAFSSAPPPAAPEPGAAPPEPEAPPAASPAGAMASTKPLRTVNKRFRLTHDSPVYQTADGSSAVLGQVHRRKYVRVTGITGDWLQVTLRDGTVGFIPVSTAE